MPLGAHESTERLAFMSDPKRFRPGPGPHGDPAAKPAAPARTPAGGSPAPVQPPGPTGKVVHDERGNAVWDWIKHTGRVAIDSTSRLLRKLEAPDLKVEDSKDEELRIMDEDPGGGYDPYNQRKPRKPGGK